MSKPLSVDTANRILRDVWEDSPWSRHDGILYFDESWAGPQRSDSARNAWVRDQDWRIANRAWPTFVLFPWLDRLNGRWVRWRGRVHNSRVAAAWRVLRRGEDEADG